MAIKEFTARLDCEVCGEMFDGTWREDLADVEQLDAAPVADQECPNGHVTEAVEYPGWTFFGEAG